MSIEIEKIVTNSPDETESVGTKLAQAIRPGSVVTLHGELGAGKTVFARGFARGLGIAEEPSSPTYTVVQEYSLPDGGGFLYHMDLYRIDGEVAALAFGVDEFLSDSASYALVEWPERIAGILPDERIEVTLEHLGEGRRAITVRRKS